MDHRAIPQSEDVTRKIGIEFEFPVTSRDYFAAQPHDLENLFNQLILQGWHGKSDVSTGALIGVRRESATGVEVVETDFGVCTLEVALAPIIGLQETVEYWHRFRLEILLPLATSLSMRLLGYGNQPRSGNLKTLIANKGHYQIFHSKFSDNVREWYLQNFPGLASAQFNFDIPKESSIQILNTLFALSPLIWAGSNNDSIAVESLLPYKSQRFFAYRKLAGETLTDRYGTPRESFTDLCDYINRMWDLPIFEVIREDSPLRPANQSLTTNQFIQLGSASFLDLNNYMSVLEVTLEDLKSAIYFSWLDFRLKIFFHHHINLQDLTHAVHEGDQISLFQMIDYIVIEVRPIAMQSHGQEIDWMVFIFLILEHIDSVEAYTSSWSSGDVHNALFGAQKIGLSQTLKDKKLGEIGLDILDLVANYQSDWHRQYLHRIHSQFSQCCSPGDAAAKIFREHGLQTALEYLTINA